jgi:hypothetical protein
LPYVRHLPTAFHIEQTDGDAITRSLRQRRLKDAYTHELEYFPACAVGSTTPKTSPEDFVTWTCWPS